MYKVHDANVTDSSHPIVNKVHDANVTDSSHPIVYKVHDANVTDSSHPIVYKVHDANVTDSTDFYENFESFRIFGMCVAHWWNTWLQA